MAWIYADCVRVLDVSACFMRNTSSVFVFLTAVARTELDRGAIWLPCRTHEGIECRDSDGNVIVESSRRVTSAPNRFQISWSVCSDLPNHNFRHSSIERLTSEEFKPENYKDEYRIRVLGMLDEKSKARESCSAKRRHRSMAR